MRTMIMTWSIFMVMIMAITMAGKRLAVTAIAMAGKSAMVTVITMTRRSLAAMAITMMGESAMATAIITMMGKRLTRGFAKRGMVMTMFTAMTTFTVMRMAMATLTITNTGGWRRSGRSLARER